MSGPEPLPAQARVSRDAEGSDEDGQHSGQVQTKDDYRLLVEEPDDFGKLGETSGRSKTVEHVLKGPTLPVLSYCAASILMTVVNKVWLRLLPFFVRGYGILSVFEIN
jgi:hypothetical protein